MLKSLLYQRRTKKKLRNRITEIFGNFLKQKKKKKKEGNKKIMKD